MQPIHFVVRQSRRGLTAISGLAFVGIALHRFAEIARRIDPKHPVRQGLPSSQILASYVGLLVEGNSDFEAIESKREDRFFGQSLGLSGVPSAATLRQRMDALGVSGSEAVDALLVPLLKRGRAHFSPGRHAIHGGHSHRAPGIAFMRSGLTWIRAEASRMADSLQGCSRARRFLP